ncbi:hypothetical protein EGW08_002242 [Elysia chlorotica]|uniref:Uncharacterized protein n=1 Tax=Elysia chlorotica TaxID=188477 RepID=A0A3S1CDU1_ELYCH|nr:hypothetical protein EGW08_002242 [Elysia chlorotica]
MVSLTGKDWAKLITNWLLNWGHDCVPNQFKFLLIRSSVPTARVGPAITAAGIKTIHSDLARSPGQKPVDLRQRVSGTSGQNASEVDKQNKFVSGPLTFRNNTATTIINIVIGKDNSATTIIIINIIIVKETTATTTTIIINIVRKTMATTTIITINIVQETTANSTTSIIIAKKTTASTTITITIEKETTAATTTRASTRQNQNSETVVDGAVVCDSVVDVSVRPLPGRTRAELRVGSISPVGSSGLRYSGHDPRRVQRKCHADVVQHLPTQAKLPRNKPRKSSNPDHFRPSWRIELLERERVT